MVNIDTQRLAKRIEGIVGFGAVSKLGIGLREDEVELIALYCESRGGDYDYVRRLLMKGARPFSVADPTFKRKCGICTALENYCCC